MNDQHKPDNQNQVKNKERVTKSIVNFVKNHRTEIIVGSIVILASLGVIAYYKGYKPSKNCTITSVITNKIPEPSKLNYTSSLIESTENTFQVSKTSGECFSIRKHPRTLPAGYHPSAEKVLSASSNGLVLTGNQTWVKPYEKCALSQALH
jgi:hypothetical protein